MIRIKALTLPYKHSHDAIEKLIVSKLKISRDNITAVNIIRKSIDARRKNQIKFVYTIDISLSGIDEKELKLPQNAELLSDKANLYIMPKSAAEKKKTVIAGSGPAGLLAGLMLARLGYKPIIIERGKAVEDRIKDVYDFWKTGKLDPESNVQFGEGGAGTFSDGKLASQVKDKANRSRKVLSELIAAGAPEEIMYHARPHIGTDNLIKVVRNIRKEIISLGGEVLFESRLTSIKTKADRITGITINENTEIDTDNLILAIGHSARDTFEMLHESGVAMEAKPFSIGVRIEHKQGIINKSQYNTYETDPILGAADYKLVHHCPNGRSAYTFCMCPGGEVIASSSEAGMVATNGMSHYKRSLPNANSALLVGVTPADFASDSPLAGIEFQRKWERQAFVTGGSNYAAPVQLVGDFLASKASTCVAGVLPTYKPGFLSCDLAETLPDFVAQTLKLALPQLDKKLKGFASPGAVMTAIETRSSCPLRILRDETFQNPAIRGLYPAGEGAGYAGGIMSAAIDGIKIAEAIINCQ
ncbi:MAG: NAD(P)/FAD-dependent oxidoreductase [Sedimentisphaeraceae bacterium JB056]